MVFVKMVNIESLTVDSLGVFNFYLDDLERFKGTAFEDRKKRIKHELKVCYDFTEEMVDDFFANMGTVMQAIHYEHGYFKIRLGTAFDQVGICEFEISVGTYKTRIDYLGRLEDVMEVVNDLISRGFDCGF